MDVWWSFCFKFFFEGVVINYEEFCVGKEFSEFYKCFGGFIVLKGIDEGYVFFFFFFGFFKFGKFIGYDFDVFCVKGFSEFCQVVVDCYNDISFFQVFCNVEFVQG